MFTMRLFSFLLNTQMSDSQHHQAFALAVLYFSFPLPAV